MGLSEGTDYRSDSGKRGNITFWTNMRQNIWLKIISLAAAILLYAFVQQDRHPILTKNVYASVVLKDTPSGIEAEYETKQIEVSITGPRAIVERLKDGDVKAIADMRAIQTEETSAQVHLTYSKPAEITIENPQDHIKLQLFKIMGQQKEVTALYKKQAPPGLTYGFPVIRPATVRIRGREDKLRRVEQVVANATSDQPMSAIEGDFPVSVRDADGNSVEGVTVSVETVHVNVSLIEEPYTKFVAVSTPTFGLIPQPYKLTLVKPTPDEVEVIGRPDRVKSISIIETEPISIAELTADKTVEVNLVPIPNVTFANRKGKPIMHVSVRLTVQKLAVPTPPVKTDPPPTQP